MYSHPALGSREDTDLPIVEAVQISSSEIVVNNTTIKLLNPPEARVERLRTDWAARAGYWMVFFAAIQYFSPTLYHILPFYSSREQGQDLFRFWLFIPIMTAGMLFLLFVRRQYVYALTVRYKGRWFRGRRIIAGAPEEGPLLEMAAKINSTASDRLASSFVLPSPNMVVVQNGVRYWSHFLPASMIKMSEVVLARKQNLVAGMLLLALAFVVALIEPGLFGKQLTSGSIEYILQQVFLISVWPAYVIFGMKFVGESVSAVMVETPEGRVAVYVTPFRANANGGTHSINTQLINPTRNLQKARQ